MSNKKTRFRFFILVFSTLVISSCGLVRNKMSSSSFSSINVKNDSTYYSPIIWNYDTLGNGSVKKGAMYVMVYIKDLNENALMQFDLGANLSGFYKKTLNLLIEDSPDIQQRIKSTKKGVEYFENASFSLNNGVTLYKDHLYLWKNMGHDTLPESTPTIGTIGYDILTTHVLIIDYINDRIALVNEVPNDLEKELTYISKVDLSKFPPILPFKFGGKRTRLFFDTGSSSHQIITGTKRLKKIAVKRELVVIDSGYSWGKQDIIYKAKVQKIKDPSLYIGDIYLGQVQVSGTDKLNLISWAGRYLYGITGNVLFENCIVVIDRKNNRFGIVKRNTEKNL